MATHSREGDCSNIESEQSPGLSLPMDESRGSSPFSVDKAFGWNGSRFTPGVPFVRPEGMTDFTIIHLFANNFISGVEPDDLAEENQDKLFNLKRYVQVECANCRKKPKP